jgi:hypothetical protein
MPGSWAIYEWSASEGFGGQATQRSGNGERERIWFSPACLATEQGSLFDADDSVANEQNDAAASKVE